MSEARELFEGAGRRLLALMQERPGWDDLDEQVKDRLREAALELGQLTVMQLAGHDVQAELAHVRAQIASWEFVSSAQARRCLNEGIRALADFLGAFLGGLIRTGL